MLRYKRLVPWCHCLKTGPICCTETSVTECTLRNTAEDRRSQSVVTGLQLLIKQRQTGISDASNAETHWPTRTRFRVLSRFVAWAWVRQCFLCLKLETFWNYSRYTRHFTKAVKDMRTLLWRQQHWIAFSLPYTNIMRTDYTSSTSPMARRCIQRYFH